MTTTTQHRQDRARVGGLTAGAAVIGAWALTTGSGYLAVLASGTLVGALLLYRRTAVPRPYAHWPAWAAGAVIALLLAAVSEEATRLPYLLIAAAEATVTLVLATLWSRRRDGSGDWIVWLPDKHIVLRREWSSRRAIRWAQNDGRPCMISPLDETPELAAQTPRFPHRDRPRVQLRPEQT